MPHCRLKCASLPNFYESDEILISEWKAKSLIFLFLAKCSYIVRKPKKYSINLFDTIELFIAF